MPLSTAWVQYITPYRLRLTQGTHSAGSESTKRFCGTAAGTPALLTSIWIGPPSSCSAVATMRCTSAALAASAPIGSSLQVAPPAFSSAAPVTRALRPLRSRISDIALSSSGGDEDAVVRLGDRLAILRDKPAAHEGL